MFARASRRGSSGVDACEAEKAGRARSDVPLPLRRSRSHWPASRFRPTKRRRALPSDTLLVREPCSSRPRSDRLVTSSSRSDGDRQSNTQHSARARWSTFSPCDQRAARGPRAASTRGFSAPNPSHRRRGARPDAFLLSCGSRRQRYASALRQTLAHAANLRGSKRRSPSSRVFLRARATPRGSYAARTQSCCRFFVV